MLEWKWGKPLIQGFSNKPQKGYSEITSDAGVPFRRLNFTDIGDLATCNFTLTRIDYIHFMSWYKFELRQGTLPFEIWDCRYGIKRIARLVDDVPNYNTNSNRYNLSLTLFFESGIIYPNYRLIVGKNKYLIVNSNNYLTAAQPLRI